MLEKEFEEYKHGYKLGQVFAKGQQYFEEQGMPTNDAWFKVMGIFASNFLNVDVIDKLYKEIN